MISKKPKVVVFIDGANVFYAQKHLGWTIDWKKARTVLENDYKIQKISYYTGIRDKDEKMEGFLKYLRYLKFETITKPLKIITDEEGKTIRKSNMDVEIAVDAMLKVNDFDNLILFSGDSDFVYLSEILKRHYQKKVVVYSSRKTISWELKLSVDSYFFLEDLKSKIKRQDN